jgi:hypothetical protein
MMGLLRRAAAVLGVLSLCWMTGCAGFWVAENNSSSSGSGSTTGNYVYVANENLSASTASLSGFAVDTTLGSQALSPVSAPIGLTYNPAAMVVNPANSILFVANNATSDASIYAYAIGSGGALTYMSSGGVSGLSGVAAMDISPDGQWLFALANTVLPSTASPGNYIVAIYEFQINSSTGVLTPWPSGSTGTIGFDGIIPASGAPQPLAIKTATISTGSGAGSYVFVALGTAGDMAIPFNTAASSGALSTKETQLPPSFLQVNQADVALAVNEATSTLYIARKNSTSSGVLASYTISMNGSNAVLTTGPTGTTGDVPVALTLSGDGSKVYVANSSSESISGFSTTPSGGSLPALTGSPYLTAASVVPYGLSMDNSGNYLLTISSTSEPANLAMYQFDATNLLDPTASASTGSGPLIIAATHNANLTVR